MEFPGLNLSVMSDSDIYKKIGELNSKMVFIYNTSGNSEIIFQLSAMLETLQHEQMLRISRKNLEVLRAADPVVVDTDPEITVDSSKADKKKTNTSTIAANNPFIPKRTKTPTSGE